MSFRTRLALAFAVLAVVPLLVFGLGVRGRVRAELGQRYRSETTALAADLRAELSQDGQDVAARLGAMADVARQDNRLRLALAGPDAGDRGYLLDYAGRAMRMAGLAMLRLEDADGTILSSGHFRNEFGRREPGVAERVAAVPGGTALLRASAPSGPFLALARTAGVRIGGRPLVLVGGLAVDSAFLARLVPGREVGLELSVPGFDPVMVGAGEDGEPAAGRGDGRRAGGGRDRIVETIPLPYVAGGSTGPGAGAELRVSRSLAPLRALRRGIDVWLVLGLVAVAAAAALFGSWLAARLSRPLADLARRTARLDLERLDVEFPTERRDEVGVLARGLRELTDRLRAGSVRLREAERRATLGEISRQVNHDVRNGLTPLRHVVRHLAEVARKDPDRLAPVFEERRDSLEGGLGYLETLATRYARLSSRPEARPVDAAELVARVAADAGGTRADVRAEVEPGLPPALADPVALRRVLENLARNAVESLDGSGGAVWIRVRSGAAPGRVRLEVEDTGPGMSEEERERMFEEFYTTREEGAGLGLAIVRRLVTDMEGEIEVDSEPGRGTRFVLTLRAAGSGPEGGPAVGSGEA
ncbi:MAG TPA: HAMP domain-containing sensor histidine kinase [Gemmatimonadota bacterium]|nr:HAMP domain-containing sensor histidine kinase [Gemmatimonadota bacterium]